MNQGNRTVRRPKLPGPRPVLPNPEQDAIVRILWRSDHPRLASEVFGRVELCVPGPTRSDVIALATEAQQLERRGLLQHGWNRYGLVTLTLTPRGRRFIGLRYGDYKRPMAASLMAPVVVACTSVPPSQQGQSAPQRYELAELPPKPSSVVNFDPVGAARQVVINGKKTWLWCTSNDCIRPTLKEEVPEAISAPKPIAMPLAAPLPSPAPVAAVANTSVHSVFFAFAAGTPERSEEAALAKFLRGVDRASRVTVLGMTDKSGSPALNGKLAQRRAEAIRALLVKHGFAAENISVQVDVTGARAIPAQVVGGTKGASGDAQFRRVDVTFDAPRAALSKATRGLDGTRAVAAAALQECVTEKASFKVPPGIRPKMHLARFEVAVEPGGRQTARAIMLQSSGISAFDAELARAVERCMAQEITKSVTVPTVLTIELDLFAQALKHNLAATRAPPVAAKSEGPTASMESQK